MMEDLSLDELREQWPNDDSGLLAARLLRRYLVTKALATARGAECVEARAQAESAANKAFAEIIGDLKGLGAGEKPKPAKRATLQPLSRFSDPKPNPEK